MTVTYHVGDTRDIVASIPDGSVDLIATSPPFLALRSYLSTEHPLKVKEIGSEQNPAAFIDMLLGLTAEWGRVLAPHGSIAIELGDTYAGSGGAGGDYNEGGLRDGQQAFVGSSSLARTKHEKITRVSDGSGTHGIRDLNSKVQPGGTGWPRAKSLALIPQLYAVALAYGINPLTGQPSPAGRWLVRNVIVWHRPNPAVGALGDKVRPSTSYIVIATRSPKRWFDLTAVRTEPVSGYTSTRAARKVTSIPGQPDRNTNPTNADGLRIESNNAGAPPLDCWLDQYDGSHDTWTLTTQPSKLCHYAMWPAKLAERLVLMMCPREVCTVCGEPRRRVETATFIPHGKINGNENKGVRGYGVQNGEHAQSMEHGRATKVPTTLGWTDCGCSPMCSEWLLCEQCHYSWLRDPTRPIPTLCPECRSPMPPTSVFWGERAPLKYRPGVVLDPFAGSGTTLAVADLHQRDAIGIDFDRRNHDIYPARFDEVKRALFGTMPEMPGQMELAL